MGILIVTGTGTGIGKTVVTAAIAATALAAGSRVAVVKPAQTGVTDGEAGDVAEIRRLAGEELSGVELTRYPEPLAPATAARRAGLPFLRMERAAAAVRALGRDHDLVLVEGAGGILVPFDYEGTTLADLARLLEAPVVNVVTAGLGTLNATALTAEALRHRGLECPGIVVGSFPADPGLAERCNLTELPAAAGAPLLGVVPAGAGRLAPPRFRAAAPGWLAPRLPGTRVPWPPGPRS
ncbi:dethiobiotin synthase [Streptomyces sp. ACA25]|uniref:dethiobiotin synthase n=1 Tax=Streptomyces sp. ACA25 TaxID=3022596 RepID=UPI002307C96C|nr:dethiobiotin synthase [Streptomyces sp. ACA25]MDB1089421.1 dethiobiotin synthase [Streptomyces sp. ACA25]